ncbi:hypothetical protein DdX_01967 [Ditylenchus destructor]|uniref:Uncharacterized protein n=1 Tax=Ditylenchus destructor TaxID=166010 RepID=A0AAD4R5L0_9BILA|nr:hypothetical protein DdX_01967 [Ditylenchus destructor]
MTSWLGQLAGSLPHMLSKRENSPLLGFWETSNPSMILLIPIRMANFTSRGHKSLFPFDNLFNTRLLDATNAIAQLLIAQWKTRK